MNSAISAMPSAIAEWLDQQEALEGIGFLTEYPAANKAVPLRDALVAVGLDSVRITDKFVENNDGVLERQEYCRSAAVRLRLSVHVPFAEGGDRCHDIFTSVLDMITFASDLNVEASGCGSVTAHRDTDAFVLEAWAQIVADFCPAVSTGLSLGSFLQKELLCGSHIGNEDIHLTSGEKDWLGGPFRMGTYPGNGSTTSSQTVEIGARARAVFVFPSSFPAVYESGSSVPVEQLFGFAIRGESTNYTNCAMSITQTGFTVGREVLQNSVVWLNKGITYNYFAIL
ncbi:MAG: hypothetical protein FWH26_07480 [Oscillospiraceae bacterium]|nr:hypothetical protein [Oscillospiraceae bacterium]